MSRVSLQALPVGWLEPPSFVFHSLRHFAASSMLAEGAPITAVAGHLGDTVETVQRTYAHWLRDDTGVPATVLALELPEAVEGASSGGAPNDILASGG
jgi:integrase